MRHLSAINSVLSAREGVESQAFAQLNGQDENLSATSDVCGHQFTNQQGISWILMVSHTFHMFVAENGEFNPQMAIGYWKIQESYYALFLDKPM